VCDEKGCVDAELRKENQKENYLGNGKHKFRLKPAIHQLQVQL
jgi:hypothetical protein